MNFSGEIAAVSTALCWSTGSLLFTFSSRKIGSAAVNHTRLGLGLILLVGFHTLILGKLFPYDAEPHRFLWLGISGVIGFAIGDSMLFEAFVLIGPRLSMLLMMLAPIFSTVLAWIFLAEKLAIPEMLAIIITIAGIAWVVSEKKEPDKSRSEHFVRGIIMGIGGASGQAVGLLFAKKGLANGFSPISGNLIRVSAAFFCIAMIAVCRGKSAGYFRKLKDKTVFSQVFLAALIGLVLGVGLSLYSIAHTGIGVASTLMSLSPLFLLPLAHIFLKEKISPRAIVGALVAFAGSVILFFV